MVASVPQWAQDLILRVAVDEGRDSLPELTWRKTRRAFSSSGRAWPPGRNPAYPNGRVIVTAGIDRKYQKLTLLHELAHWLSPVGEHHGPSFWDKAWELYRRYGVPIRFAKEREESHYRKGALAAYSRSRKA